MKKYYLILFQGLRREVFYWELINTIRKVLIVSLNTILSVIPLEYKILLGVILLIIIVRIQIQVRPYKMKVNNDLEIMSIVSGMLVLYCGLIFEEGQESNLATFDSLALFILIVFNIMFFTQWLYYFLVSLDFKNENLKKFVKIYGMLLCKSSLKKDKLSGKDLMKVGKLDSDDGSPNLGKMIAKSKKNHSKK